MTRFYLNQKEITPPPGMTSFDQILAHVDEEKLPPNSVIRMICIDGIPLIQNDLSKDSSGISLQDSNCEKVEIVTGTVEEIVDDSIEEALEYLNRIEVGIHPLAESFQANPGPESFQGLRQLYEGFYWLNILMDKLSAKFKIDFNDICIQEVPVKEHNRKYTSTLKQLQDSQERGDMVLISDLLEYEIAPIVPVWKEMFQIISKRAGTTQIL